MKFKVIVARRLLKRVNEFKSDEEKTESSITSICISCNEDIITKN